MPEIRINRHMTSAEWGLLFLLSMLWGGAFFFMRIAVETVSPLTLVATRVSLAAIMLHLMRWAHGIRIPRGGRVWLAFFTMGLLNNIVPYTLISWSEESIVSGLASILNATAPFFTIFVAHYFTHDEKMTPNRVIGIGIGFIGVVWLIGPEALQSTGSHVLAQGACLVAAFSYACAAIFGRRFAAMGLKPLQIATGQLSASTLLMLPASITFNGISVPHWPWTTAVALGGLALLSTALAFLIYFRVLSTAGATNLLLANLLIPISAILLSVVFLGEHLKRDQIIAASFIGAGLLLIDGRLLSSLLRRRGGS